MAVDGEDEETEEETEEKEGEKKEQSLCDPDWDSDSSDGEEI